VDRERDEKVDAVIAALRDGLSELPTTIPSELALALYASSVVDGVSHHGFKIVKMDA
jgi:hypothetical protein